MGWYEFYKEIHVSKQEGGIRVEGRGHAVAPHIPDEGFQASVISQNTHVLPNFPLTEDTRGYCKSPASIAVLRRVTTSIRRVEATL
jgi:hypothetical protein